jgi:signal transduction histidine kinase/DNA-binding response OmpR family regulator/CHASE3 domain sensor protein
VRIRSLFIFLFGVLFALITARGVLQSRLFSAAMADYDSRLARDGELDEALEGVAALTMDLEMGVRGFQITHEKSFLEPYLRAEERRRAALDRFVALERSDAQAAFVAERVREQLEGWSREVARPLVDPGLAADGRASAALTAEGKRRMDEIRGDLEILRLGGQRRRVLEKIAFERYQQDLQEQTLWLAALTGVVLLALGILVVVLIARPLGELVEQARRIGQGDFRAVTVRGVTEVTELARAASQMAARLEAERNHERSLTEKASALARELDDQRAALEAGRSEDRALREALARANEELRARNEELQAQEEALRAQSEALTAGQSELELRNEELGRASRLKSDFLASMSHELRTPLNAVIGFSDLLLAGDYGPLAAAQEPVIRDVNGAGHQLLTLINDVLDLSKIEAGRVEVSAVPIDVAATAAQACKLLASAAVRKSVRIVNRVPEGALFAAADPDKLRQVVVNLLSNAVKFTPEGGSVTIEAAAEPGRVRLSVIDTGIGIAAADVPKLFVPFSQLESGYARRFQGTGLGLSICKRLIELMGGDISLTSELGKGTTLSFTLPASSDVVKPPSPRIVRAQTIDSAPAPGAKPRILVIEDERDDALLVELILGRAGYAVTIAASAEDALAMMDALAPALLVVDLGLPGLSGLGFIEWLRASPRWRDTPVVVLSGRDLVGEEHARLEAMVDCVARKGDVSRVDFSRRIQQLCPPPPKPSPRRRVLVVDDNEANRKVLRAMLQRHPCEVIEAGDASAGLLSVIEQPPDVILMDIQMPDMDGLAATALLKADPGTARVPIIAVSAHAMAGDADRALAAGCVAYIPKPVSRAALYEAIGVALGPGWQWS